MKYIITVLVLVLFIGCRAQSSDNMRGYKVKVGDMAPDFTLKTVGGEIVQLSSLRGKVVMLQFTATWCGVCRKEMPHIEKDIWLKHKSNDEFSLFGIDREESVEKVKYLIDFTKITYPILMDTAGTAFTSYAHKSAGITRNILIDREGRIVFLTRLFEEMEFKALCEAIDKELKK